MRVNIHCDLNHQSTFFWSSAIEAKDDEGMDEIYESDVEYVVFDTHEEPCRFSTY